MKRILGIIGSPRKLGNCEMMAKEISRHVSVPHELTLLRLPAFNIEPCRACYRCLTEGKRCPQEDDFYAVLDAILAADALILSVPTYFLRANSCLKRFLDRGLALYDHIDKLWSKPAVGVGIAGIEGKEGYTLLGIQNFLSLLLAKNKLSLIVYGALPGEVFLNDRNKIAAADLASALFGASPEKKGPHCPLCGGDTFRFLDHNNVRCMLCSNSGTINLDSGRPLFQINSDGHELFLTKAEALEHKQWLLGMKARFIEKKKELKSISVSYLKEGTWIKPPQR